MFSTPIIASTITTTIGTTPTSRAVNPSPTSRSAVPPAEVSRIISGRPIGMIIPAVSRSTILASETTITSRERRPGWCAGSSDGAGAAGGG